jgi:hypothetical protein
MADLSYPTTAHDNDNFFVSGMHGKSSLEIQGSIPLLNLDLWKAAEGGPLARSVALRHPIN